VSAVIDYLRRFNRKERFFLVGAALGNRNFALGDEFRRSLSNAFALDVPPDAFVGMDYHFDWIYASVFFRAPGRDPSLVYDNPEDPGADQTLVKRPRLVSANQEDIDLIVAFDEGSEAHIIMLEAKAETGWTNKQARSKARRLKAIFDDEVLLNGRVRPHFGIVPPYRPRKLSVDWPGWALRDGELISIPLEMPGDLTRLTRCDANGVPSALGLHFRLEPRSIAAPR
jgi:hypothetical protein